MYEALVDKGEVRLKGAVSPGGLLIGGPTTSWHPPFRSAAAGANFAGMGWECCRRGARAVPLGAPGGLRWVPAVHY